MENQDEILRGLLTKIDYLKSEIEKIQQPIAIVGLSCRFPGGAESPEQFWSLLEAGFDSSIEIPKDRWDIDLYYDPNLDTPGKIVSRKSSFITSPIANFDADFFGITPREAEMLDPQQRLLLEVTWEALEAAGIEPKTLNQSLTGVFIGISSHDYEDLLTQSLSSDAIDAYFATGNAASTASGRISYTLGLQGPSVAVDTACSSSIVSLHQACQSLHLSECDMAIAGGVNVILAPQLSIDFSQAHMLAADGHCKTFDKTADGYVRGEGCGIVVLKRLSDAQRDNDKIFAVIKGSAVNQDGASGGLTIPNGPAQEAVIRHALTRAKLEPNDIDYIEAHGTGTALGDPIEVNALAEVFKGRESPLIIGTVKTNMGHLEAAAGIAAVIKTVLALQHEKIPQHLHYKEHNPHMIDFAEIPAQLPLQALEWKKQTGKTRRAGISSFGFSGTNAHLILEEAPAQDLSTVKKPLPKTIFNRKRYWSKSLDHEAVHYQLALPVTGLLEDLHVETFSPKALASNEVLVKVQATAVNLRDVLATMKLYPGLQGAIGLECAGQVIAVADDVKNFQVGDSVFGIALGSYADRVIANVNNIAKIPAQFTVAQAAALPIAYLTADIGLMTLANLKAGEKVLIHAAAGGVGLAAVQVARAAGAIIYATAGNETKRDYLRNLGITHLYDSRSPTFSAEILADTDGAGVDVVLNSLTGEGFIAASVNCCAKDARFIEIGRLNIWTKEQMKLVRPDIRYEVMQIDDAIFAETKETQKRLAALVERLTRGELSALPITEFPFKEIREAFMYLERAKNIGKVVIRALDESVTKSTVEQLLKIKKTSTVLIDHDVKSIVRQIFLEITGLDDSTLDEQKGFFELGIDSLMASELNRKLLSVFGDIGLSSTVIFEHPTLASLSEWIEKSVKAETEVIGKTANITTREESVAIIGMSCRLPKSQDVESFWRLLQSQEDAVHILSGQRLYHHDSNKTYYGSQVDDIDQFDPGFFGISPREAELMDPQQRLLLEVSWEALEDAGKDPKTVAGSLTGVFIGAGGSDYYRLLSENAHEKAQSSTTHGVTGGLLSALSGRISYVLGLQGPSLTLDTACSSSLVAVHEACESLRRGECDLALGGGVNVILDARVIDEFASAGILSPSGHCHTFDAKADGYVRGEGCGIIVLKRLSDAKRDNDRILAVIRATGINQDGASGGFTVPNGTAQEQLLRTVVAKAQVEPQSISYVETHGTGTVLGDPIEVNAITRVYGGEKREGHPLILGALKSQIGHLETAAGIAGLIKVVNCFQHEKIPGNLHFETLNPRVDLAAIPGVIPTSSIAWPKNKDTDMRRAALSAFGFTGTNAHIILEEAPEQNITQVHPPLPKTQFNRQRYWANVLTYKHKKNIFGEEIHPLLGHHLNETVKQKDIIYEQTIDLSDENFYYLRDHKIFERVLYPATGYIELVLGAAKTAGSNVIEISDLNIERPLELNAPTVIEVVVENEKVWVYSKSSADWLLHSTGVILKAYALKTEVESLSQLEARITEEVNISDFYNNAKELGIAYGPSFRMIKKAKIQENEALLYLDSNTFDSRYLAYPALVDGGLQGIGLFGKEGLYLPVSIDLIHWEQALPTKVVAHIMFLEKTPESIQADIYFYAGKICILQLKGFHARRVTKDTLLKMLAPKESKLYYEPVWDIYTPVISESINDVMVYDARTKIKDISITPAIALLTYLQKLLAENTSVAGLHIITENAYGNNINLNQGSLNGLIKTAILEHPELNIRQLDISEATYITPLLEVLAKDTSNEQILQYREGKWLTEHIVSQTGLHLQDGEYRLVKSKTGIIEQLTLVNEEVRVTAENEILIAPRAVGLNFRDVLNAMNLYPGDPGPLGGDVAGIIKAVGKNITRYRVGDEVVGLAMGCLSSQAVTREHLITLKPQALQFSEAATIPTVFITAYLALVKLADLKADETVLIHAGTGGVGLAAIQIATYCKAKIIATAGSEKKREYLHNLGIEHVFDSRSLNYKDAILRVTHNHGVDVVLNSLSGEGFIEATLESAGHNARVVEIGKRDIWSIEAVRAKRDDIIYHIVALDQMSIDNTEEVQQLLQEVMQLFEKQILKPVPYTIFPLSQAVAAFKYLQQAKQIGKVVITMPPTEIQFNKNASYLITGGLGGIGQEIAKYLTEKGAGKIILAARQLPSSAAQEIIAILQNKGTQVITYQVDIGQKEDVEKLLISIKSQEYPLKGIFHVAGAIDDATIDKQIPERFEKVFAPKALGAWHLHELTQVQNICLDYFVLFSSIASLNGSPAQSNYATANSFLDALAQFRKQQKLAALSINWGPWAQVGMAKALAVTHEYQGLIPFKTEEGIAALDYALRQELTQLGIIHANWKRMSEQTVQVPSWLQMLLIKKQKEALLKQLNASPLEQREQILKIAIMREVKTVLGLSADQLLDENKGLFELGLDSLMALELKNRLQVLTGKTLDNTFIFDQPNITSIVSYFCNKAMINLFPKKTENVSKIDEQKMRKDVFSKMSAAEVREFIKKGKE